MAKLCLNCTSYGVSVWMNQTSWKEVESCIVLGKPYLNPSQCEYYTPKPIKEEIQ